MTNHILDQLHNTRRQLLDDAGGTLEGLVVALQKRQQQSGRQIIKGQQADSCTVTAKTTVEHPTSPIGGR
jgi:hypothetical protein